MCSGFVLEPSGHRQGRGGKALAVSMNRVGGSIRIGGGADRGVAPAAAVGLSGPQWASVGLQLEHRWLVVTRAQRVS